VQQEWLQNNTQQECAAGVAAKQHAAGVCSRSGCKTTRSRSVQHLCPQNNTQQECAALVATKQHAAGVCSTCGHVLGFKLGL